MILIHVIDYVSACYCIYVLTLKDIIKITSKFPNKTNKSYLLESHTLADSLNSLDLPK